MSHIRCGLGIRHPTGRQRCAGFALSVKGAAITACELCMFLRLPPDDTQPSTAAVLGLAKPNLCRRSPVISDALVAFNQEPPHIVRADAP